MEFDSQLSEMTDLGGIGIKPDESSFDDSNQDYG